MRRLAVVVLAVGLSSCGGGGPDLFPVRGTVLFDGQPADGASVAFQPVGGGPTPSGIAGPDGTFTLHTHPHGAGAPAGEYTVVVTWYPPDARSQDKPKNKLPAKYAGADSPLRATVKPGENALDPFKLTR
jgi:hypothetical protein